MKHGTKKFCDFNQNVCYRVACACQPQNVTKSRQALFIAFVQEIVQEILRQAKPAPKLSWLCCWKTNQNVRFCLNAFEILACNLRCLLLYYWRLHHIRAIVVHEVAVARLW